MKRISSAATSSRVGFGASSSTIALSAQGFPWAARPTITAAAPVVARTVCARALDVMSRSDHGHVDALDELGGQRVIGLAVYIAVPSAGVA